MLSEAEKKRVREITEDLVRPRYVYTLPSPIDRELIGLNSEAVEKLVTCALQSVGGIRSAGLPGAARELERAALAVKGTTVPPL